jgi:uncharacterized protein YdeI (BOF family)
MMRVFIIAIAVASLTVPAFAQSVGSINQASQGAARAGGGRPPEEPKVDPDQQKKAERAFKDAVNRIPGPEKKFDPWGNVRTTGK